MGIGYIDGNRLPDDDGIIMNTYCLEYTAERYWMLYCPFGRLMMTFILFRIHGGVRNHHVWIAVVNGSLLLNFLAKISDYWILAMSEGHLDWLWESYLGCWVVDGWLRGPWVAPKGVVDVGILHGRSDIRRPITDFWRFGSSQVQNGQFDFRGFIYGNRLPDDDGIIMNTYCLE